MENQLTGTTIVYIVYHNKKNKDMHNMYNVFPLVFIVYKLHMDRHDMTMTPTVNAWTTFTEIFY